MQKILPIAAVVIALLALVFTSTGGVPVSFGNTSGTSTTQAIVKAPGFHATGNSIFAALATFSGGINITGASTMATTSTESFTRGGTNCTLTDANGGTYTLTDAQTANCGVFTFAASGAGQEVIALTFPATSTMALTVPNSGDCRQWLYDASALAAATTTTLTAGTGHDVIAATTNDDVIDGLEFSQIEMCRQADTDVTTYVNELLHAD